MGSTQLDGITETIQKDAMFSGYFYIKMKSFLFKYFSFDEFEKAFEDWKQKFNLSFRMEWSKKLEGEIAARFKYHYISYIW